MIGLALDVVQQDRDAKVLRQLEHRRLDAVAHFSSDGGIFGISRSRRQVETGLLADLEILHAVATTAEGAATIERGIGGNPIHEGGEASFTPEPVAVAVEREEQRLGIRGRLDTEPVFQGAPEGAAG